MKKQRTILIINVTEWWDGYSEYCNIYITLYLPRKDKQTYKIEFIPCMGESYRFDTLKYLADTAKIQLFKSFNKLDERGNYPVTWQWAKANNVELVTDKTRVQRKKDM